MISAMLVVQLLARRGHLQYNFLMALQRLNRSGAVKEHEGKRRTAMKAAGDCCFSWS